MTKKINKAMVLAAGRGERMRPLTDNCPKPLLKVSGRTMLDRALDDLQVSGVTDVVVNTFYLGHMIEEHLQQRQAPRINLSREDRLLDTGGGVKKVLSFFGNDPFFVLNGDVIWTEGPSGPVFSRLESFWDDAKMDVLLLLYPVAGLPDHAGAGDYYLPQGAVQPVFKTNAANKPNMIFTGPRIVHPRLFAGAPDGAFSFTDLFHKAEAAGRLYALVHDGAWYHVGTPEALQDTEKKLHQA